MCEREGPGPEYHDPLDHEHGCSCDDCEACADDYGDCDQCGERVSRDDWDCDTERCKECRQKISCPKCEYPQDGGMCQDCRCEIVDVALCEGAD